MATIRHRLNSQKRISRLNDYTVVQGLANFFSIKGETQNILVFVSHAVSLSPSALPLELRAVTEDVGKCLISAEKIRGSQCARNRAVGGGF